MRRYAAMQGIRTPPMRGGDPAWARARADESRGGVCACVPAAGRAGERGAEIRRQNASHRASIAHHHRAATAAAAAATAATTLRGPAEMAHLERRSLRVRTGRIRVAGI